MLEDVKELAARFWFGYGQWMPQNPKGLANKLKRLAPTLRQHGFRIETGDHSRQGWTVIISKEKEKMVTMVTRSPGAKTRHFPGDCTGDHGDYAGDDGDHADFAQSLRKASMGAFCDRVTMVTQKFPLFDLEKERTSEATDTQKSLAKSPEDLDQFKTALLALGEGDLWKNRESFVKVVKTVLQKNTLSLNAAQIKAIWKTLGEPDELLNSFFTRHFCKYVPPRSLEEIDRDLKEVSSEIMELLREITE